MVPELKDFINQTETPEMADVLVTAHATLDRIGLVGYDERFRELINTEEMYAKGDTVVLLRNLTQDIQIEIITQHGVIPQADCSIEQLDMLIGGLLDIQDYEVYTDVTDCVQDGVSSEEQFAQMLELVTPWPAETLLDLLESVSDAAIKRICEYYKEKLYNGVSMEEQPNTVLDDTAETLRRYGKFLEGKELLVFDLIKGGLRIGYPLAIYLRTYGDEIAGMEPKRAAEELIGLTIISADAKSTPQEAIREIIDEFVASLDSITRIDSAVKDIVLRFERYEKA